MIFVTVDEVDTILGSGWTTGDKDAAVKMLTTGCHL